jgi:predicted amidohydrolase
MSRLPLATLLLLFLTTTAHAQELMPPAPTAWAGFAARAESMPALSVSQNGSPYGLSIYGNGVQSVYGGWRTRIQGLNGGAFYRFRTRATPADIADLRESITILLRWRGSFGDEVSPDYVWDSRAQPDGSLLFDRVIQAPPGTTAVDVELILQWSPTGRVMFDALSFSPAQPPASRPVRVAAVFYRPSGTASGRESVQRAAEYAAQVAAAYHPDVMVLGEMLNVVGAPGSFDSKAESVPGPSTDVIAGIARGYAVNIAFGILERSGNLLYNTAVLMNRSGDIIGRHHKMQVPLSETSAGVTPGDSVPVFTTDVGRVGLLICHDLSFPEPTRETALKNAELLLVPFWGGKSTLVHARAAEHAMYVAVAGYDYASEVVDPLGRTLDVVTMNGSPAVAVADIDLTQRFREDWLGDWRDISNKERRIGPYEHSPGPPPPVDQTPPSVTLSSPASNATVSGSTTVAATAADNVGVTVVRFLLDGGPLGPDDTAAPYSWSWDTTTASNGPHTVTAVAYDAAGNNAASSINVTVSNGGGAVPVTWTALVNVTANGSSLTKTSGCDGCQDAGAISVQSIASGDGYVELSASELTTYRLVGLSRGNTDTGGGDIDFGVAFTPWASIVEVRENGVYRAETSYAPGDVFRIAVESGVVNYYRNGVRFYGSSKAPAYPLNVDTSFVTMGGTLNAVVLK